MFLKSVCCVCVYLCVYTKTYEIGGYGISKYTKYVLYMYNLSIYLSVCLCVYYHYIIIIICWVVEFDIEFQLHWVPILHSTVFQRIDNPYYTLCHSQFELWKIWQRDLHFFIMCDFCFPSPPPYPPLPQKSF